MCMDVKRALGWAVQRSATRLPANRATNWATLWTNPVLLRMINPDLTQVSWDETLSLVKARPTTASHSEGPTRYSDIGQGFALLHLYFTTWASARLYCQYITYICTRYRRVCHPGWKVIRENEKKKKKKIPQIPKKTRTNRVSPENEDFHTFTP